MKLITNILAALVLLSPLTAAAQTAETETPAAQPVSRDSIMTVVQAAKGSSPESLNIMGNWYYLGENLEQDYNLAARMWAKAASLGNVAAIGNLGMCYQFGHGVEQDSVKAMGLYTKSLRQGNPGLFESIRGQADCGSAFECAAMGHFLTEGIGCKKDYLAGAKYYTVLARRGDVDAMRDAGLAFLNGKDYKNALTWFKKGSEAGNVTSTYYYGRLLVEGLGTTADPSRGFVFAMKAAEAGLANAQYLVSQLYREGKGVSASVTEADKWLRTAAYQGLPKAMFDYALVAAAKNEFVEASYLFSWLRTRKSFIPQMKALFAPTDTTNILDTPFGHYTLALQSMDKKDFKAAKEHIKALKKAKADIYQILEAQMLLNPDYDKHDTGKALKQLTRLAETSDYARVLLARIYERGIEGVEVDTAMARQLLDAAAANGFALAMVDLGNAYYEGIMGVRDYATAVDYYRSAYDNGFLLSDAASRFATCLDEAQGTVLNPALAAKINGLRYPASIMDFLQIVP